jgi:predicted AlkP superfamily pyrophosphatase or phosphodiesterase
VYRKAELPPRWRFGANRRVAPIVGVADEGWSIGTRSQHESMRSRWNYGNHGYDNAAASMRAIFIARGPSFRRGVVVPAFENIHLYELLCRVLRVRPAANDGRIEAVASVLSER